MKKYQSIYYIMKESITLIIILLSLVFICVYIISKIETFYNEEVKRGVADMKSNTSSDLTEQDKYLDCPNGADFKQIANSYVQCCKLDSNKAVCEHPTFKKCKNDYLKVAKDNEYIKYFGNENTYDMAKLKFQECINTMNDSLSNYNDISYNDGVNSKNYIVTDLHPLNNKSNISETCKNMCNMWQNQCKGYSFNDSDCMLHNSITEFLPMPDNSSNNSNRKIIQGNNLKIKN